jgi:hypothetical protein
MWRRWKAGESLHEIGRAFGKDHGSIQFLIPDDALEDGGTRLLQLFLAGAFGLVFLLSPLLFLSALLGSAPPALPRMPCAAVRSRVDARV